MPTNRRSVMAEPYDTVVTGKLSLKGRAMPSMGDGKKHKKKHKKRDR